MNSKKIVLIILLIVLITIIVFLVSNKRDTTLTNSASPAPSVFSYNPPKEIKYDGSTDLKKELETINPQVLDSDFTP